MESRILIVDDDCELLETAEMLISKEHSVKMASSVEKAKSMLLQNEFDVVVADLNFEGQEEDGIALLDFISERIPEVEVVVLSGDSETARVVDAMRRNLVDFIPKSGEYGSVLRLAIARGLERKRLRDQKARDHQFLTNSPRMKALLRTVQRIASSPGQFPILITGETGTGKEVLAKYIAKLLGKNLVAANMASIPRETAESELFGHARGAFTGAVANKAGLIEQAHNGIFFLDELGECSPAVQAKLLRVIQEKELQAVGTVRPKKIDVRFLAATNCNLNAMVASGTFRLDLLQRLNTIQLHIPALRDRPEDVVLYANQFLTEIAGPRPYTVTSCGVEALLGYSWPGNVRELRNVIERITILSDKRVIDGSTVREAIGSHASAPLLQAPIRSATIGRAEILAVLETENGNRTRAAARLGVHTVTLQRWIKRFGIQDVFGPQPGRPSLLKRSEPQRAKA